MNKDCFISIIIPVYNAEIHLKECLESIFNQTYKKYELICVNDGSTDRSVSIIKEYCSRINNLKMINTDNFGVSHARNVGMNSAKGDYICFIDSDDVVDKNFLEDLIKEMENEIDLVQCQHSKFKEKYIEDGQATETMTLCEDSIYQEMKKIIHRFDDEKYQITISVWGKLYKKSIINDNNLRFNEKIYKFEDGIFNLNYLSHCHRVMMISKKLYGYRVGNVESLSQKYDKNKLAQNEICIDEIYRIINNYYNDESYKIRLDYFIYDSIISYFYACLFRKENKNNKKKYDFSNIVKKNYVKESIKNIKKTNKRELLYYHAIKKNKYYEALLLYKIVNFFHRRKK